MGLDSVDRNDDVGFRGCDAVEVYRDVAFHLAQEHRFHGRADRSAHRLLRDPELPEELLLPFRRRAAVAAHRRDDERLGPHAAQLGHGCSHHFRDAVDAPAADGERNPGAFRNRFGYKGSLQRLGHRLRHVADLFRVEGLAHWQPPRQASPLKYFQSHKIALLTVWQIPQDAHRLLFPNLWRCFRACGCTSDPCTRVEIAHCFTACGWRGFTLCLLFTMASWYNGREVPAHTRCNSGERAATHTG